MTRGTDGAVRSAPLDGIRALAVVAVLAYHAHYSWAVGGYLGVDVFFVLSGFLITRVLLKTERSWRGYRDFLVRRAVRLLPALVTAVTGMAVVAGLLGDDRVRGQVPACTGASLGYVMNLPFAEHLDCPAMWHITWSLAAEQQFYLLWPLLLAGLLVVLARTDLSRWGRLVASAAAAAGLWLLSVVWQVLLLHQGATTSRVAYAPDGRSLVLLLGCALALATSTKRPVRVPRAPVDVTGVVAVGVLLFCLFQAHLARGVVALLPTVSSGVAAVALVWAAAHARRGSLLDRTLGAGPVAWLGRVSYSLYLWHEVAYRLAEQVAPRGSWPAEVLRFVLALGLAASSYRWVELPAQRWYRDRAVSDATDGAGAVRTSTTRTPPPPPSPRPRPAAQLSTPAGRR